MLGSQVCTHVALYRQTVLSLSPYEETSLRAAWHPGWDHTAELVWGIHLVSPTAGLRYILYHPDPRGAIRGEELWHGEYDLYASPCQGPRPFQDTGNTGEGPCPRKTVAGGRGVPALGAFLVPSWKVQPPTKTVVTRRSQEHRACAFCRDRILNASHWCQVLPPTVIHRACLQPCSPWVWLRGLPRAGAGWVNGAPVCKAHMHPEFFIALSFLFSIDTPHCCILLVEGSC